ncbi:MAG TPA: Omp28-related outer membrane protein [Bacteroidia bacterium]|nr:Omp28-related outer membrane protein [Bacteroidia bacterium]
MKTTLFTVGAICTVLSVSAQLPVSTTPQNKKAVLEEFTGIHCGYCPDGHKIATNIYNADPNNVVLINIHTGGYATPSAGEPDFRTSDGNSIAAMPGMGITGYPTADINRTIVTGTAITTTNRSQWPTYVNTIKSQPAYCNVALQGTLDAQTRVLTVQAEVYYTANSPVSTNSLTIVLLENNIPGPQSDYGNFNPTNWFPDGTYKHNHVLRKVITPTFGVPVSPTTAGSLFSTTVTYTVPTQYPATGSYTTPCLLGRLELAAFVTQTNTLTINAAHGPIYITNIPNQRDIAVSNLSSETEVCAGVINPKFWFTNNGSDTATTITFTYAVNGGSPSTYTWNGMCPPYNQQLITINNINFTPLPTSNTLQIGVASVNNNTDQNNVNDIVTKVIPTATLIAPSINMQMDFTQDQYGTEIQWQVIEESTGIVVAQDGPWSDLSAAGTLLHTKTFTLVPNTCYKLVITDAYGDGACCSYGNGSYNLKSNGNSIFSGPASYGKGLTKWFKTDVNASVSNNVSLNDMVSIYPNPANEKVNIFINSPKEETIKINVINALGQVIYSSEKEVLGEQTIQINTKNFAEGIYHINIQSSNSKFNKTISVTH